MGIFRRKKSSKKYVDLIEKAASKWANWDPAKKIKVGSYGYIDRMSGAFVVEGQINDLKSSDGESRFTYLAEESAIVDVYKVKSVDGTCKEASIGANIAIAGTPYAKLQWGFEFNKSRGAFLMMIDHRIRYLPDSVKSAILKAKDKELSELQVITAVYECKAYCLYLSDKCSENVSLKLEGSVPIPNAPALTVGGLANAEWAHVGVRGTFQGSVSRSGEFEFTPLFEVEKICSPERRRDDGPVDDGAKRWGKISAPWGALDSDGEEEMYISDDEEEEEEEEEEALTAEDT